MDEQKINTNIKQKRMGIILGGLLAIVLLFLLLSNSLKSSAVPEQLIQHDISNKFGSSNFHYSTTHSMDKSTHIDTVTIEITVSKEYYQEHMLGTCKYRYNKANDTWDSYGEPNWKTVRVEYLAHKYTKKWDGDFGKRGGTYSINITAVDFRGGTVTGSFTASKTAISLGGGQRTYSLDASGTYAIKEQSDGYILEITQSGYTFVFLLSRYYGVEGRTIYNARTGVAV